MIKVIGKANIIKVKSKANIIKVKGIANIIYLYNYSLLNKKRKIYYFSLLLKPIFNTYYHIPTPVSSKSFI